MPAPSSLPGRRFVRTLGGGLADADRGHEQALGGGGGVGQQGPDVVGGLLERLAHRGVGAGHDAPGVGPADPRQVVGVDAGLVQVGLVERVGVVDDGGDAALQALEGAQQHGQLVLRGAHAGLGGPLDPQELVEGEALGDGQAGAQDLQVVVDVGHAWDRDHVLAVDGDRLVPLEQVPGGRRGRGQRGGVGVVRDDARDQAVAYVYVAAQGLQVAAHQGGDVGDGVHGRGQEPYVRTIGELAGLRRDVVDVLRYVGGFVRWSACRRGRGGCR